MTDHELYLLLSTFIYSGILDKTYKIITQERKQFPWIDRLLEDMKKDLEK